ncbi:MAG: CHAT domain-containing protein, partial [Saprospiraceae bacterium]
NVLFNIAKNNKKKRDYDTALRYLEESLRLIEEKEIDDVLFLQVNLNSSIGAAYKGKQDFPRSKTYYHKALELLENETSPKALYEKGTTLHDFAEIFLAEENYNAADSLLQQSLKFFKNSDQECGWNLIPYSQAQSTRANFFYYQKKYAESINIHKTNIQFIKKEMGDKSLFLTAPLNNIGLNYNSLSQFDSAHYYYEIGRNILTDKETGDFNFSNVNSPIEYSYLIWNMAENFYWKHKTKPDVEALKNALHYFDIYVEFLDYLRNSYQEESTRIGFAAENKIAYEKCLEVIFELQKIEPDEARYRKTFSYLEKSKSLTLLEAFKLSQQGSFKGVPEKVLAQEKEIRSATQSAESIYYYYKINFGEKSKKTQKVKSDLFQKKEAYQKFLVSLQKEHKAYYKSKYQPDVVTLKEIQKSHLNNGQCMLNYYEGQFYIYAAFISNDKYKIIKHKKDFQLLDWVNELRGGITNYYTQPLNQQTDKLYATSMQQYIGAAQKLYKKLLAPFEKELVGFSEIIIIPDGQLANIPFESLLKSSPIAVSNFDSYPFLIRDFQLSYCYSATLLVDMKEKQHFSKTEKSVLAFAPFAISPDDNTSVAIRSKGNLKYSDEGVKRIVELWGGEYKLGKTATKKYFKEHSPAYKIIHLSTHGVANTQSGTQSFLVFFNPENEMSWDSLYVRELYDLQLNTDLVVLSACETNLGELQIGEGIISVARAFAYAGTKSVLATLWKVSDEDTKNLTVSFYDHLKKNNKAQALHLAKKEFLDAKNNRKKHPFFWAAMLPIGDMSAIK